MECFLSSHQQPLKLRKQLSIGLSLKKAESKKVSKIPPKLNLQVVKNRINFVIIVI